MDEVIIIGVSFLVLLFASFLYPSIIDLKQSQRLQSPRFVLKVTLRIHKKLSEVELRETLYQELNKITQESQADEQEAR